VCRRSGLTLGNYYGRGLGQIWLNHVYCMGNEMSLAECGHSGWGSTRYCSHWADVSVVCDNSRCWQTSVHVWLLSAQCVSSIGQIMKSVCVSVSEWVSEWVNIGTPSKSWERLKLETSNLVYRLATEDPNEKNAKLCQKGSWRGNVTYVLKFWDPLHISGTVKARNFKFGTQIGHWGVKGYNAKLGQRGSWWGHVIYF